MHCLNPGHLGGVLWLARLFHASSSPGRHPRSFPRGTVCLSPPSTQETVYCILLVSNTLEVSTWYSLMYPWYSSNRIMRNQFTLCHVEGTRPSRRPHNLLFVRMCRRWLVCVGPLAWPVAAFTFFIFRKFLATILLLSVLCLLLDALGNSQHLCFLLSAQPSFPSQRWMWVRPCILRPFDPPPPLSCQPRDCLRLGAGGWHQSLPEGRGAMVCRGSNPLLLLRRVRTWRQTLKWTGWGSTSGAVEGPLPSAR